MTFLLAAQPCPVCSRPTQPYDCVDFNKNCEELNGKFIPLSLKPVYYFRCSVCGFVHSPEIRAWTQEQFKHWIYNDEYIDFDPSFQNGRPQANARMLQATFERYKETLDLLDYGGGTGVLAETLRSSGFKASTYDPFYGQKKPDDGQRFDLITAFEVIEHFPEPRMLMVDVLSMLKEDGIFIFSTSLSDQEIAENGRLTWWYAAPRNGHICLFSLASLQILASLFSCQIMSFNPGVHGFYRALPQWAIDCFSQKVATG